MNDESAVGGNSAGALDVELRAEAAEGHSSAAMPQARAGVVATIVFWPAPFALGGHHLAGRRRPGRVHDAHFRCRLRSRHVLRPADHFDCNRDSRPTRGHYGARKADSLLLCGLLRLRPPLHFVRHRDRRRRYVPLASHENGSLKRDQRFARRPCDAGRRRHVACDADGFACRRAKGLEGQARAHGTRRHRGRGPKRHGPGRRLGHGKPVTSPIRPGPPGRRPGRDESRRSPAEMKTRKTRERANG